MDVLFFLILFLLFITLIGHGIWVLLAWMFKKILGGPGSSSYETLSLERCANCNAALRLRDERCIACGCRKLSAANMELMKDLGATSRQVKRLRQSGAIEASVYEAMMQVIEMERGQLAAPLKREQPAVAPQPAAQSTVPSGVHINEPVSTPAEELAHPVAATSFIDHGKNNGKSRPAETVKVAARKIGPVEDEVADYYRWASRDARTGPTPSPPAPVEARKPFTEVLASFMEQSNIRWGEIIGGLLIIGCSTALVVSLWNEIARIPVLKFFIFTTVTAALFAVGLYTEHRWKLPTTSRAILTIATLLVPLNFLAIATVSGGVIPAGAVVIASELIAPALFLCLVYFAGRIITPGWPQLLASGVLGSSVGQLLVRHFAGPGVSHMGLMLLGAFPLACYVATSGWMLRRAGAPDEEIDESGANAIFITLGASTFAALLPYGLLLFKTGQAAQTLMHIAPLVSIGGVPLLASGLLLWRRVTDRKLAASRTAGTSIAIIGALISIASISMAWPNLASMLAASLFNFAIFTMVAVLFEMPLAHLFAASCLALAYLLGFHVMTGHIGWQSTSADSLLSVLVTASSGQALAPLFVMLLAAAEGLLRRGKRFDGRCYLAIAGVVAAASLALVTWYGFDVPGDPYGAALVYGVYAAGAFWIAWRNELVAVTWIASGLLLVALTQTLGAWLGVRFPLQAAMLAHASITGLAAIIINHQDRSARRVLVNPLNWSALAISLVTVWAFLQANLWQPTGMISERLFWFAGVWLTLLWLNRSRGIFAAFQVALTCAVALAVKAHLQDYEWYAYLPHASLHPWSLQIQGSILILLSLAWIGLRLGVRRYVEAQDAATTSEPSAARLPDDENKEWSNLARQFLNWSQLSFDRVMTVCVLGGFVLLAIYGALPGINQELATRSEVISAWDMAGFAHAHALEAGSWILLGLLLVAMFASLWEQRHSIYVPGAMLALACACPLLAGRWEAEFATASALRWFIAGFVVLVSLKLWFRDAVLVQLKAFGLPEMEQESRGLARRARILLLILTLTPLLALTLHPALKVISDSPTHGPSSGFFYLIGARLSYAVPLVLVALALIGHAVRERAASYAFSAGLLFNLTVTMAQLLTVAAAGGSMNMVVLVQVLQLNAITSACYALLWLGTRDWWVGQPESEKFAKPESLLKIQVGMGLAANLLLIGPTALRLFAQPDSTGIGTFEAGSVQGWLALALSGLAVLWFGRAHRQRLRAGALCVATLAVGSLIAFDMARWDVGQWRGYHALLVASVVASGLMLLARWLPGHLAAGRNTLANTKQSRAYLAGDWDRDAVLFAVACGVCTITLALRATWSDPGRPWWTVGALVAMGLLSAGLNWQTLHRLFLYAAGLLFNLAATIWWATAHWQQRPGSLIELAEVNIIALALPGIAWMLLELHGRRNVEDTTARNDLPSFHHVAAFLSSVAMVIIVALGLLADISLSPLHTEAWLGWLALSSVVALLTACLWDSCASYAVAGLYLFGLTSMGLALDQSDLAPRRLGCAGMVLMAAYALVTGALWRSRETLMAQAARLRIPRRGDSEAGLVWLRPVNALLAAAVVGLAYWIVLTFVAESLRILAAAAVAAQVLTFGLLAQGAARARWQRISLGLLVQGTVLFGWAWLMPGASGTWLNRAVVLMIVMLAMIGMYGAASDKAFRRETDWTDAVRSCLPWMAGAGLLALMLVLGTEVFYQMSFGAVRINLMALLTVAATLLSASVMCVLFAVAPARDPLKLSESGRMKYVYVSEVMLALLFIHIRLTMPWLFSGFFERYWPIVVVAIAFLGVTISEALRRQGLMILAQPVERTGAFLPLLPVLGFWIVNSRVDYSSLLFMIGLFYGGLSILRRSFGFGMLAALAGNGGLWYLLHHTESYGLVQHPQLWLIPAALSVLLAAYLNRDRFSEEQMTSIRYITLMIIYVSSTSDIFINGVAQSPWLPLILAAISIAGVMCGIMLRVRAFLFLGATFLLIAVMTMIWYASVNLGWTWLWYVAGIVTGTMIIFTFAMFEKKRGEMLRVVEDLRGWES